MATEQIKIEFSSNLKGLNDSLKSVQKTLNAFEQTTKEINKNLRKDLNISEYESLNKTVKEAGESSKKLNKSYISLAKTIASVSITAFAFREEIAAISKSILNGDYRNAINIAIKTFK
jgi:uncharacterized protein YoxC